MLLLLAVLGVRLPKDHHQSLLLVMLLPLVLLHLWLLLLLLLLLQLVLLMHLVSAFPSCSECFGEEVLALLLLLAIHRCWSMGWCVPACQLAKLLPMVLTSLREKQDAMLVLPLLGLLWQLLLLLLQQVLLW